MGPVRRRSLLIGALSAGAGAATVSGAHPGPQTFVLVHGAWHGGWCWSAVSAQLRAMGHTVFTPTLTGLGDRYHLRRPDIDLTTHIKDVTETVETEELTQVVLVGHSYAGMVVAGAAARLRPRLSRIVYFDTAIPKDGQSLADIAHLDPAALRAQAADGNVIPFPPLESLGVPAGSPGAAWLTRRLRPHPLGTWLEPVSLGPEGLDGLAGAYIRCVRPSLPLTAAYAEIARRRGWPVTELQTGHDAMVTLPSQLAAALAA